MTTWTSPTSSSEDADLYLHRDRVSGAVQVEVAFTSNMIDVAERPQEPGAVEAALAVLEESLTVPVARMRQVHGIGVHEVRLVDGRPTEVPEADALVTTERGVALMTRSADCVPVLLADVTNGVIGALHAGRVGFDDGVVPAAVEAMRELGAEEITAWLGPAACGRCYEVPAEMRADVAGRHPAAWTETRVGTPALDVVGGVREQLVDEDVDVLDLPICTMEDERTFSHRRQQGAAGRAAGLVWMRP
ncbi:polyphenol oxidase family protein [Nocardioides yefusunii]|uniref:Polyphenol oxidase family protein n=1 Tax=Nocardioides yefusunii TaxID=2500546 RepID=A0ABW1QXM1_9ACTN|nr:polyphenol oxidase family protein [Nocardioides yefusunii]